MPRPFSGPIVTHMTLYGRSISIRKGVKNDAFFLFTSRIFFGHRKKSLFWMIFDKTILEQIHTSIASIFSKILTD